MSCVRLRRSTSAGLGILQQFKRFRGSSLRTRARRRGGCFRRRSATDLLTWWWQTLLLIRGIELVQGVRVTTLIVVTLAHTQLIDLIRSMEWNFHHEHVTRSDERSHGVHISIRRDIECSFELFLHETTFTVFFVDTGNGQLTVLNVDLERFRSVENSQWLFDLL